MSAYSFLTSSHTCSASATVRSASSGNPLAHAAVDASTSISGPSYSPHPVKLTTRSSPMDFSFAAGGGMMSYVAIASG